MAKQRARRDRSRHHRSHRDPWELRLHPGPVPGPGVSAPPLAALMAAVRAFDPDAPWAELRSSVLPMFERRRPFPPGSPDPFTVVLPPGVTVGFGIDLGPALARIGLDLLERWDVSGAELVDTALANLRASAYELDPPDVVTERLLDVPVRLFRSHQGWASTLVLDPVAMERVLGPAPCLVTAPMRDALLAFEPDVPLEVACLLTEELEELDPNALALEAFGWRDGRVSVVPLRAAISA